MPVTYSQSNARALLVFANAPVNALSVGSGLVQALSDSVARALGDDSIEAVIIAGEGELFCAGADIKDFDGDPGQLDILRGLLNQIEASPKPVVMAIRGVALGGGLELAMAGHYRIAATETKLGVPEVTLGLLPGAGGTQRLPRLVGSSAALDMMLSGKAIDVRKALTLGLVDQVVDGDPVAAAHAFIHAHAPLSPRATRTLVLADDATRLVAAERAKPKKRSLSSAPDCILDCVQAAATQTFDEGLALEARLFTQLMASQASLGLRHAFFGERQVARIPGQPRVLKAQKIGTAAVIGGGLMGTGIAITLLNADLTVILVEPRGEALARARATIRKTLLRDVEKGRLSQDAADARLAKLTLAEAIGAVADADLVIEAVFEDMEVKREVFGKLDRIAKPSAILASNTSTLNIDAIAALTTRPEQVVGLHFFSPANIMRLLEVVRGAKTAPQVLATAMGFAKTIGKVGVVAGVCDGFIGNRIFEEYLRQAYFLLEEGALPQQVDKALEDWGMAMGPLRTMDLAGQDIGWSIRKRRAIEQPDRPYSKIPDQICEQGRFGQKVGKGFYLYPDGRTAQVDPQVDVWVVAYSADIGMERRQISDEEIVSRCLLAMANEGAKILEEGVAYRPVDIDMVYLNGYGFPKERGGPMFYADQLGLSAVLASIRANATGPQGWSWKPAKLLVDLTAGQGRFEDLNT